MPYHATSYLWPWRQTHICTYRHCEPTTGLKIMMIILKLINRYMTGFAKTILMDMIICNYLEIPLLKLCTYMQAMYPPLI